MTGRARKTSKKSTTGGRKRGSGKRELVENRAGAFYARRGAAGKFREMDERGRSLAQDRRRKATTTASAGRGDRGDRSR